MAGIRSRDVSLEFPLSAYWTGVMRLKEQRFRVGHVSTSFRVGSNSSSDKWLRRMGCASAVVDAYNTT
eukprot:2337638-Amphidinium_carterae.1